MWLATFPVMFFPNHPTAWRGGFSIAVLFFISITTLNAQLIPITPFSGITAETFESFPNGFITAPLTVMGGAASVQTSMAAVVIVQPLSFNFSLGDSSSNAPGHCAVPADGQNLLGIESGGGVAALDVVFTNSVKAFGGFWGAAADINFPATITFTFFDAGENQIGVPQSISYVRNSADGVIEWHGWFSTIGFKRVHVASSGSTLVTDSLRAGASGFSVFTSISPLSATQYVLRGNGDKGVVYAVQVNTNLSTTDWVTVGTAQADADGALQFTNSSAVRQKFYRLQVP